jgi:hypothetical protein
METDVSCHGVIAAHCERHPLRSIEGWLAPGEPVLTDAVLMELKKRAGAGCLLCAFEALEPEDWD